MISSLSPIEKEKLRQETLRTYWDWIEARGAEA